MQPLANYQAFLSEGDARSRNAMFRAAQGQGVLERTTDVPGLNLSRIGIGIGIGIGIER